MQDSGLNLLFYFPPYFSILGKTPSIIQAESKGAAKQHTFSSSWLISYYDPCFLAPHPIRINLFNFATGSLYTESNVFPPGKDSTSMKDSFAPVMGLEPMFWWRGRKLGPRVEGQLSKVLCSYFWLQAFWIRGILFVGCLKRCWGSWLGYTIVSNILPMEMGKSLKSYLQTKLFSPRGNQTPKLKQAKV